MDIFSSMFAMTQEYEAHGKTWVLIDSVQMDAAKTGMYWLAVEKGATLPAPIHMILKLKDNVPSVQEGK
jgi:hypothetical protein